MKWIGEVFFGLLVKIIQALFCLNPDEQKKCSAWQYVSKGITEAELSNVTGVCTAL